MGKIDVNFDKSLKEEWSYVKRQSGYSFIDPLLECEIQTYGDQRKFIPFEKELVSKIEENIIEKNPDLHLSLYFRNLQNGPWFGINENENFSPASLLKLPLMIAYFKRTEENQDILNQQVSADKLSDTKIEQNYLPKDSVQVGKVYTIKELLFYLIVYSDNNAADLLSSFIPENLFLKVYKELDIPLPKNEKDPTEEFISVKDYASFFRILYNASYLDRKYSETALNLLSQSTYKNWIVKNIPKDIIVAHKFWERKTVWNDWIIKHQLHDCWIVYYSKYPYLICIMTKWATDDFSRLEKIIQEVSTEVFNEIKKNYP